MRRLQQATLAGGLSVLMACGAWADPLYHVIARTDQPIPGVTPPQLFTRVFDTDPLTAIGSSFLVKGGGNDTNGLWLDEEDTLRPLVLNGDPAPGFPEGSIVTDIAEISPGRDGRAVFRAGVRTGPGQPLGWTAIFEVTASGVVRRLLATGDPVAGAGGTGTVSSFAGRPAALPGGGALVRAALSGVSTVLPVVADGAGTPRALVGSAGSSLVASSGAQVRLTAGLPRNVDADGAFVSMGTYTAPGGGPARDGCVRIGDDLIAPVLLTGDVIPDGSGCVGAVVALIGGRAPQPNRHGQLVLVSQIADCADPSQVLGHVIWLVDQAGARVLVRSGQPIPAAPPGTVFAITSSSEPAINDLGEVLFVDASGVYLATANETIRVAQVGDRFSGHGGGVITAPLGAQLGLNSRSQAIFLAGYRADNGSASQFVFAWNRSKGLHAVGGNGFVFRLRPDDTRFGRPLIYVSGTAANTDGLTGLDDLGRFGFRVSFAEGGTALIRADLNVILCPADADGNGALDADDLATFIRCYFGAAFCDLADFNRDGDVNADDVSDYIVAYFAGCTG